MTNYLFWYVWYRDGKYQPVELTQRDAVMVYVEGPFPDRAEAKKEADRRNEAMR